MSNISYVRAGASCLPMIGPFVALYNAIEVKKEMEVALDPLVDSLISMKVGLIHRFRMETPFSALNEARQELQISQNEFRNKYLLPAQKGRIYAICGIAGNVLSVALLVALTAFGVLSGIVPVTWGVVFTFQAIVLSWNLYQHNKTIQAFQPLEVRQDERSGAELPSHG